MTPYPTSGAVEEQQSKTAAGPNIQVSSVFGDQVQNSIHNSNSPQQPLRYPRRGILLFSLYIPLVVVPWVVTCILSERPFTHDSYANYQGFTFKEIDSVKGWVTAINVLNSVASVVTIPILSALLAQAAVVYSQRRAWNQHLSVRHLFALADRGWSDFRILVGSWGWKESGSNSARGFLHWALFLIFIGAIQQPLYQIFVSFDQISVTSCLDTHYLNLQGPYSPCHDGKDASKTAIPANVGLQIGLDYEPAQMAILDRDSIVDQLRVDLTSISEDGPQPNLWLDFKDGTIPNHPGWIQPSLHVMDWREEYLDCTSCRNRYPGRDPDECTIVCSAGRMNYLSPQNMFVAALPLNTTTGVLREHIMRINSSVSCTRIDQSWFPSGSACDGSNPLKVDFARQYKRLRGLQVCAPGDMEKSPWTLSRHRQDISEEIYIHLDMAYDDGGVFKPNGTLHCKSKTTRGYFELGNYYNNQTYGPLLEKWPGPNEMLERFNDIIEVGRDNVRPSEEDILVGEVDTRVRGLNTPGPLLTSALALFGESSWFAFANNISNKFPPEELGNRSVGPSANNSIYWNPTCATSPFNRMNTGRGLSFEHNCNSREYYIGQFIAVWLGEWNKTHRAEQYLAASMMLVNQAMLSSKPYENEAYIAPAARKIMFSPGINLVIPRMSLVARILGSILIAIQIVGLIFLAFFIYHVPTWTTVLNADSMARVGARLGSTILPPLGPAQESDRKKIEEVSGLVGVHSFDDGKCLREASASGGSQTPRSTEEQVGFLTSEGRSTSGLQLELGASGVIRRDTLRRPFRPVKLTSENIESEAVCRCKNCQMGRPGYSESV